MSSKLYLLVFNTLFLRVLTIGIIFANGILLARYLGSSVLGYYVLAISAKRVLSIFFAFGTGLGITYYTTKHPNDKINIFSFMKYALTFSFLPSVMVLGLHGFLDLKIFDLILLFLSTFVFCFLEFVLKAARGLGKYKVVNKSELLVQIVMSVSLTYFFLVDHTFPVLSSALYSVLFSEVIALLFALYFLRAYFDFKEGCTYKVNKMVDYSKWSYLSNSINIAMGELPVILFRAFSFNIAYTSYFSRSQSLLNVPRGFFIPISQNLFFSFSKGNISKKNVRYIILIAFLCSFIINLFFFYLSKELIVFLYGDDFLYAANYIKILSVGMSFLPISLILSTWLSSQGLPKTNTFISGIGFLSFLISLVFLFFLGFEDLSIVISLSIKQVVTAILYLFYFSKEVNK